MKDVLQDIISHTLALGVIELIKVSGTDKETVISALAEDRSVIITGKLKTPHPEFMGVFGMPNLAKLKTILGFQEYDEHSTIAVTKVDKEGESVPVTIHFETKTGDFVNDYRLMSKAIVEEKVKNVSFKGASWNIEFEPTAEGVRRLKLQSSANSEETVFSTKQDGDNLKVMFGDISTHSGNFVFHSGLVGATSTKQLQWPVKQFLSIMDLVGDKKVRISDQGAAEITVDSGIAVYQYLLPAQSK
jgi:hypothetical protein